MLRASLLAVLLTAIAPHSWVYAGVGQNPFNFLFLDAGARPVGLGGAYSALARDANALLYNPAALGKIELSEAVFMENRYIQGISQEYLGFASQQGWGVSINHLSFGDIPRTTILDPDGTGSFGIRDLALGLGFGRLIRRNLSLGIGVKVIRESIDDVSATGYAADIGVLHTVSKVPGLSLAGVIQNIGPAVRFQAANENLPLNLRLGAAYERRLFSIPATFAFDATKERGQPPLFFIGAEVLAAEVMPIRVGFNTRNDAGSGIVFGLGWIRRRLRLDYAFTPLGELGSSHRFSVGLKFRDPLGPAALLEGIRVIPKSKMDRSIAINEHFSQVQKLIVKGALNEAKANLQRVEFLLADDDPRSVQYFERLGRVFFLEGDMQFAKVMYHRAIKRAIKLKAGGGFTSQAYLGMGLCLYKQGKTEYAEKFIRKALESSPSEEASRNIRKAFSRMQKQQGAQ
ncbi:MAG: hypothetical protein COB53_03785 [Elusimicrobia bacterium]|nr:MAG: hypothetical protein COB53_03785 [Elusimicrobiota bacterium]